MRQLQKPQFRKPLCVITALLYTIFQVFTIHAAAFDEKSSSGSGSATAITMTQGTDQSQERQIAASPVLAAESAVLIDADSGLVLYDKNKSLQSFPASTTKVMTALLTIEYAQEHEDERIRFSENAVYGIERGSSHIAMDVDETLSLEEALYAIMLASANEVAAALAEHIGGSIVGFADMMNARAKEIGAKDTHFVNPHGLDDAAHYTTAYDLALIMREAVQYERFNEVIATRHADIPPTEKQPEQRPLNNSNRLIYEGPYYDEDVVGGKTGYTDASRHTLVSYATRNGVNLIAVIMRGEKNVPYTDSIALYDYGFSLYHDVTLMEQDGFQTDFTVYTDKENERVIHLTPRGDTVVPLPDTVDATKIRPEPSYITFPRFDLKKGDTYGKIQFLYEGHILAQTDLIVDDLVARSVPGDNPDGAAAEGEPAEGEPATGGGGFGFLPIIGVIGLAAAGFLYRARYLRQRRGNRRRVRGFRGTPTRRL